jgi:hypothetical protein
MNSHRLRAYSLNPSSMVLTSSKYLYAFRLNNSHSVLVNFINSLDPVRMGGEYPLCMNFMFLCVVDLKSVILSHRKSFTVSSLSLSCAPSMPKLIDADHRENPSRQHGDQIEFVSSLGTPQSTVIQPKCATCPCNPVRPAQTIQAPWFRWYDPRSCVSLHPLQTCGSRGVGHELAFLTIISQW